MVAEVVHGAPYRFQDPARFSLEGIGGGNAVFNPEKLEWFSAQHLARLLRVHLRLAWVVFDAADFLDPLARDAEVTDEPDHSRRHDRRLARACARDDRAGAHDHRRSL